MYTIFNQIFWGHNPMYIVGQVSRRAAFFTWVICTLVAEKDRLTIKKITINVEDIVIDVSHETSASSVSHQSCSFPFHVYESQ